jgi:hypothetical protein
MTSPAGPLVLGYAAGDTQRPRDRSDVPFLLLGLPALAAVVVPFTYNVSPAQAMRELPLLLNWTRWDPTMSILLVAVPFLPPVWAWIMRLRSMLGGRATRPERVVGYVVAFVGFVAVGALLAAAAAHLSELARYELAYFGAAVLVLVAGTGLLAWLWRRNAHANLRVRAALLVPYLANSAVVLAAFADDRQLGWYLTAVSAPAALAELVLLSLRNRARPVP